MLFVVLTPSSFGLRFLSLGWSLVAEFSNEVSGVIVSMFTECFLIFSCYYSAFSSLLVDKLILRRCKSRSMILTHSSSLGVTTCSGNST